MTTREKRLATLVAGVTAVGLAVKVVYPLTIKPLFDVEKQITELQDDLFELEQERDRFDDVLLDYKRLVERTGGTDPEKVRNRLQEQLEAMVRSAGLESPETRITPKKPLTDRKTGVQTVSLAVVAEGRLQPIIEFLERCYELPYVSRFKDIKLSPAGSKRRQKTSDLVKLNSTLVVRLLPEDELVRGLIDFDSLEQPSEVVKHTGESYAMVWDRKPFSEYVKPARPTPKPVKPPSKPPIVKKPDKKKPTPPKKQPGDPERKNKYIAGVLRGDTHELMVVHKSRQTREYVPKGEQLDGGRLLYVHPLGGVVRRDDGDYFYELGRLLSEAVPVAEAADIPGLEVVARQLAMAMPLKGPAALGAEAASKPGGPAAEDNGDQGPAESSEPGHKEASADKADDRPPEADAETVDGAKERPRLTKRPRRTKGSKRSPPAQGRGRRPRNRGARG